MKKISFIFGTRPEAIKLAPVIRFMKEQNIFEVHVCSTGQHREMLHQIFETFDIVPDVDLNVMKENQTLPDLTSTTIQSVNNYLLNYKPDMVLVQGDTTSAFAAALTSFYHKIPVGHIEAGLRTYNQHFPFPEELNRTLISHTANIHFAPTENAKQNLVREGIQEKNIFVTGNTVIDALLLTQKKIIKTHYTLPPPLDFLNHSKNPIVLITGHRRENFDEGLAELCSAIAELSKKFNDVFFIYPVHLNPTVKKITSSLLNTSKNIFLTGPFPYFPFVALMMRSTLILTDSGGIQEEAPSLEKPILIVRNTTERPEIIEAGAAKLVGTNKNDIINSVSELLTNKNLYDSMIHKKNPYGDGIASEKIFTILSQQL